MGSKARDVEPGTFRDACSRALLELILTPLISKYGKDITIWWPVGGLPPDDDTVDFTRAYILFRPRQKRVRLQDADMILFFEQDYLNIACLEETKSYKKNHHIKRFFKTKEFPIANPEVHNEAIAFIAAMVRHRHEKDSLR